MRKIVVGVLFLIITFFIFSMVFKNREPEPIISYVFDFEEEIDRDFWLVGPWGSFERAYESVAVSGGILRLSPDVNGIMPYMLTKPIEIRDGDVITLKRKVKIHHGSDTFSGGIAMYQTSDIELLPEETDGEWFTSLGDGVFLVEYSYDLTSDLERPGRDIIRFLAADWEYNNNYTLITPIYDEWYEEVIVFDTRSNQISYRINNNEYKLNSYKLDRGNIRFFMHPYGTGYGNVVEIDSLEITVENKKLRR